MIQDLNDKPYYLVEELGNIGFAAGVTLKGSWEAQEDIYSFIEEKIIPPGMKIVIPDQVHGTDIVVWDKQDTSSVFAADGVISRRDDTCLTITTADCLPLVLADPTTGFFGAVHIGWRSFVGGIVESLFNIANDLNINLQETRVFIGPGIGPCCFEVGIEVAELFESYYVIKRKDSPYVDLRKALYNKIESLKVDKNNMGDIHECTYCNQDKYYSYRRDKNTPVQMVTFIYKSS
jgi:polyphenol oxidase